MVTVETRDGEALDAGSVGSLPDHAGTGSGSLVIGQFMSHYPYPRETAEYFSGGAGEVVRGLSTTLARMGHDVHVFCVGAQRRGETEVRDGVTVHRSAALVRVAEANLSLSNLWAPLAHRLDVVHIHPGNPPAPFAGYIYAKLKHVPLVLTCHNDLEAGFGSLARRAGVMGWKVVMGRMLRTADRVTCPSDAFVATSNLLRGLGRPVDEVPNGIDPEAVSWHGSREQAREELGLPRDAFVILFLGTLALRKRVDVLIDAAARVMARRGDVWLVLAGDGFAAAELKRRASAKAVAPRTRFIGFVTGSEKRRVLAAASVFVIPSALEIFPVALLEAAAAGVPLVVSDLEVFRSIVRAGVDGLITRLGSVDDLEAALERLANETELRERLGRASRDLVARYEWAQIARAYEAIYRELIARKVA